MRPHAIGGEPRIEERGEAARLVLVHEDRVGRGASRATELLAQEADRGVPLDRLPGTVLLDHRAAEAIGVVEPLHRRLAARAQRPAIERMFGIALELRRATVARLGDDAAAGRALAARCGVVGGDAGHRLVGADEVRNQLAHLLGAAAHRTDGGARGAEDLQEVASLDARRPRVVAHVAAFLGRASSDSWRSRTGRDDAQRTAWRGWCPW